MTDAGGAPDPDLVRATVSSRWVEPPPEQMTERRAEMRDLAGSVRTIIDRLVATAAPTELIGELAERLRETAALLDDWPHGTQYEGFAEAANAGADPHAMFEFSPFIGRSNPVAPPMFLREADGVILGDIRFGAAYEGPPG